MKGFTVLNRNCLTYWVVSNGSSRKVYSINFNFVIIHFIMLAMVGIGSFTVVSINGLTFIAAGYR